MSIHFKLFLTWSGAYLAGVLQYDSAELSVVKAQVVQTLQELNMNKMFLNVYK